MNVEFFKRKTNITVKVIADSISESGKRMTSFELEYPRFLHCELLTHRMLSKNCSSSRAIPIEKMIEYTTNNIAMPVFWGKKKSGMKATEELEDPYIYKLWLDAYHSAVEHLEGMNDAKLHKQIANRVIEPFQLMKVVLSATDLDNFFNLRLHQDTLPEFVMLVQKMYEAIQENQPVQLRAGEWHLPYVKISQGHLVEDSYYYIEDIDTTDSETNGYVYEVPLSLDEAKMLSVASCASVSYRTESLTLERAEAIFNMLVTAKVVHSSPLEHQATPIKKSHYEEGDIKNINLGGYVSTWEKGITHIKRNGDLCSGNLTGFIQYRHLIDNNTCEDFNYTERMEDFK